MPDVDRAEDGQPIEHRFLGVVEVDSGTLLVGEPAYCLPSAEHGKAGIDYASVPQAPDEPPSSLAGGMVLLLSQFGGDGTFPVFGEFEAGELVRVTIEFIDPPEGE
jgi:hypothetical protein